MSHRAARSSRADSRSYPRWDARTDALRSTVSDRASRKRGHRSTPNSRLAAAVADTAALSECLGK